jgi:hypothetical protein
VSGREVPGGNASTAFGSYNATDPPMSSALARSMKDLPRSFGSAAITVVMLGNLPRGSDKNCRPARVAGCCQVHKRR